MMTDVQEWTAMHEMFLLETTTFRHSASKATHKTRIPAGGLGQQIVQSTNARDYEHEVRDKNDDR
eukprot:8933375-Heterocapsa_arctica.AAC.1